MIVSPLSGEDNPEAFPEGCKKITITASPLEPEDITVSELTNWEEIETELIERFQLNSVWVGLLCRLGTDLRELEAHLITIEHF